MKWRLDLALGIVCTLILAGRLSAAPEMDQTIRDPGRSLGRWTLRTSDTTLTVGVGFDHQLCLFELSDPSGWNWTATPSRFPLCQADVGGARRALNWHYEKGVEDRSDGVRVVITFTNANPALELTSVWHARSGPGPVRHTMFIKNIGSQSVTIHEQESIELEVGSGTEHTRVCYVNDDGSLPDATGVYRDALAGGYQKRLPISEAQDYVPFAALDDGGTHGMYIGWEWSIGRIAITANGSKAAKIKAGNGDDFETELDPGQSFEVPPGFVGAYQGDLDDAGNSLRKYLFNYSMPSILREDSGYPKVQWNAFAATGKGQGSWDSTESKYRPLIDAMASLGFEDVVLDIGWWPGDATHKPHPPANDPVDWPSGMLAVRNYAHDRGLRFGLYWNCNPSMTTPAGIQHRFEDIQYLYQQFKIDFYRSDGTDGNVLQTGGYGAGTRAHSARDVGYWQTKGYYEVLDTAAQRVPNFSLENCSGGGRIKDYGILKRCIRVQNQDRYYPLDARRSFYDASHVLHPIQLAALDGSWAEWQATGSLYEFRSASMGAAYWHPDAPNGGNGGPVWSAAQKEQIRKAVNTYKTRLRPLIRTANLYHIFPRPDDKVWDGVEYFDPTSGKGAVYVFRPNSPIEVQAVQFKGLFPKSDYWVWSEDGSVSLARHSGDELMHKRFEVHLAQPHTSDIIYIQDTSLGRPKGL